MAITGKVTDFSRALHVLEGLLKGIASDQKINKKEVEELKKWLDNHKNHNHVYPFSEVYEIVSDIIYDGMISQGLLNELLYFCNSIETGRGPIDLLTKEMRNLHGFIHGIIADEKVTSEELRALRRWMNYHNSNINKWPFKETYELINKILADGIVTKEEQKEFIEFAKGFAEKKVANQERDPSVFVNQWMNSDSPSLKTIDQIIDRVDIEIEGRTFCFTGQAEYGNRKDLHTLLKLHDGTPKKSVVTYLDYLVIGAKSNPCWAYSTYGRKIEKAMKYKQEGYQVAIIHEKDFIKAIEEANNPETRYKLKFKPNDSNYYKFDILEKHHKENLDDFSQEELLQRIKEFKNLLETEITNSDIYHAKAYRYIGEIKLKLNSTEKALSYFEKALKIYDKVGIKKKIKKLREKLSEELEE